MIKDIQIEKGVQRQPKHGYTKYPWQTLEIGDSIRFKTPGSASHHARRATERCSPLKFEAGLGVDSVPRVWRTE